MLTGALPFQGKDRKDTMTMILKYGFNLCISFNFPGVEAKNLTQWRTLGGAKGGASPPPQ